MRNSSSHSDPSLRSGFQEKSRGMGMSTAKMRIYSTCHIGDAAEQRLRQQGYELETYSGPEAQAKKLIVEKVRGGVAGLITTLRDPIDAEIFEAGKGTLRVVAQIAVGVDNI